MELRVATDLWGTKDNLRLFVHPTISVEELRIVIERAYDDAAVRTCPPAVPIRSVPPFRIAHMQVLVDELASKFVELVSERQLYSGAQLFVFQPPNPFHSDNRDYIPPARDVAAPVVESPALAAIAADVSPRKRGLTTPSSPQRAASPHRSAVAPAGVVASPSGRRSPGRSPRRELPHSPAPPPAPAPLALYRADGVPPLEAAQALFSAFTRQSQPNLIPAAEVRARLITIGVRPEDASAAFPSNGRTSVTWNEWLQFCELNPVVVGRLARDVLGLTVQQAPLRVDAVPESGERWCSPLRRESDAGPANARMSPRRTPIQSGERQQRVAERLSSGLSSIVTAKDRERQDFSHAIHMLPTSPVRTRSRTPNRSRK
jgi:hypothetical protein